MDIEEEHKRIMSQLAALHGSEAAAARALHMSPQRFSYQSHDVKNVKAKDYEKRRKMLKKIEKERGFSVRNGGTEPPMLSGYEQESLSIVQASKELLVPHYLRLMKKIKNRQGQRNDLLTPASGCKKKEEESSDSSSLRLDADEVINFPGRSDEWLAVQLGLESKNGVHYMRRVINNKNPVLTEKMSRRELTPYKACEFTVVPLELQNELLQKSEDEQRACIKAWKMKKKQQRDGLRKGGA